MRLELSRALQSLAASYIKRMLEPQYDRLLGTELGQRLQSLSPNQKLGVELGLALTTMVYDQAVGEGSDFKRLLNEVGGDAGPEISKRLLNSVKESKSPSHEKQREILKCLLDLDADDRAVLVSWMHSAPEADRRRQMAQSLASLTKSELERLADADPDVRDKLYEIVEDTPARPERRQERFLTSLNRALAEWLGREKE